ncbi:hypothetical protein AAG570_008849, partial [Ranatra chinensis]
PFQADSGGLCECQSNRGLFPSLSCFSTPQYCRAIDCFENRVIGCCNSVDSDTPLLRPSKTVPHLLLCDVHIQRLMRHNSCPSCGMFCTQGIFMRCINGHDYHKKCELKMGDTGVCPHCGCEESKEVKISLGARQYPVFLPMQKPPNKHPSARMTFSGRISSCDVKSEKDEISPLIPQTSLTLPSGRKLSAEGIPAVEKEKLEKLLHACTTQNDLLQRYSYRNMYQAAKIGDAEKMIQILVNPNQVMRDGGAVCALHAAASGGHLTIVHLLVQAGANTEVLDKDQNTPLMLAVMHGYNDVVKYLIKAGASVSFKGADGMTALHIAAKEGNIEACNHLLSSANTPPSYVDTVDDGRWTPLVWAAENCHNEVVRFLLEKKADPQIRDSEMNIALHWAAFAGSMDISEDLLNYNSNINLSNVHGDTPLHIAARQGAENCVVLLLARGARVDMMNKAGHIPRDCVLDPNSYCYIAIDLNMQLRKLMVTTQSYPRILSNDISRGYETNPIQCVNMIDDGGLPTDFTYISENCFTTNLNIDRRITSLTSCKCEDFCTGNGCMCAKISLRCWYDSRGKLLPDFNFDDPPMIFECNQTCNCNAVTCKNRVVQRGIKVRLQLCKTRHKNWGVITLKDIPKGSYVCEYIGEIISDCEADTREDDSYLFDLDNRDGETYCIDARRYGNITRFINHSCKPNLLPVRVFIGHHDLHFPRIAFFANRDIPANEELGFDYGEKFWIIKCKLFTCKCGTESCRYSEETIQQTLQKYKENLQKEEMR